MTQRDPLVALYQMREFAATLIRETAHVSDKQVQETVLTWNACIHLIQNVGEAASRVDIELRERAPQIPWRSVIGTRNVIAHGYDALTPGLIMDIIRRDMPALLEELVAFIARIEAENEAT